MPTAVYRKHLGTARASVKRVTAGATVSFRLTYTAGKYGVDDSGGILIMSRFPADFAALQFENPAAPNHLRITSSNPNVQFVARYGPKIHLRPWGKGVEVKVTGGFLRPGDRVFFDYRRWRFQTFCEKTFELKVYVDPIATCEYAELPRSPEIEIVAGKPAKLVVVAPTRVAAGARFRAGVKLEDAWGNPCRGLSSRVGLSVRGPARAPSSSVKLRRGAARVSLRAGEEGVALVRARCGKLSAESNPVRVAGSAKPARFWADLHAQSEETVGTGSVEEYFAFARDYAFLDAVAHQGNDFQITKEFWARLQRTTRRFNRDGSFAAFPGYEYSPNTGLGGDRNVINLREGGPLHRSSHALVDDCSDIGTDADTAAVLFRKLRGTDSLVFAHVGGRYANMDMHDDAVERAVEIHSAWGTFEWLLHDSLRRGHRVGVVANSDGHKCRPGASYPGASKFGSYGGLTCVLAKRLSRRAIFDAVFARHTYGTTGARIDLEAELLDAAGRVRAIMGDVLRAPKACALRLRVSVLGTAPIERVEVFNGLRRIAVRAPKPSPGAPRAVKVLTAGSAFRGRARVIEWRGTLRAVGARIGRMELVNFLNPLKRPRKVSPTEVDWQSVTTGGAQGVMLHLDTMRGRIDLCTDRKSVRIPVAKLGDRPKVWKAGGLDARVEAYLAPPAGAPRNLEFELPLGKPGRGEDPIYVKVVQRDGHLAWTSPIYLRA
ncbi:MAG: DUF3604 domain-containing protein [Planctomycetota bacterium]|jgi:hypothetical protein